MFIIKSEEYIIIPDMITMNRERESKLCFHDAVQQQWMSRRNEI